MDWAETYEEGSAEKEDLAFKALADDIMHAQLKSRRAAGEKTLVVAVDRAFHAKALLAVDDAELQFRSDLPADLAAGFARPGARYPVAVRISNAANRPESDNARDMRGIALRIKVSPDEQHDLLATNYPVSHARNARQFVRFAVATAGGTASRLAGLAGLTFTEGPFETVRMLRNVSAARRTIKSAALETYWSRGAVRWGPKLAVRFLLRPLSPAPITGPDPSADPDGLSKELAARLSSGAVRFELCVQRFVSAEATPIEDTSIPWTAAPSETVATLTIPQQDVNTPAARERYRVINALAFNPWNTTDEFRPLGNLNRARKSVYDASAAHRLQTRWREEPPLRNRVFGAISGALFKLVNRRFDWYRLPLRASLLNLDANRVVLRQHNLIDTEPVEAPPAARPLPPPEPPEGMRTTRSFTGEWNDLSSPKMGAVGATFGRNLIPDFKQSLEDPNPIVVARALLDRKTFLPARSLNLLAAAWIQFQVHDWVNHAREKLGVNDVRVPLPDPSASWVNAVGGQPEREMRISGNISLDGAGMHLFGNAASHWWDGSEVYGSDPTEAASLRDGAKIRLDGGYLPVDKSGMTMTGFGESFWLGLSVLHTLFVREHNLLCDELRAHYRGWSDDRIYHTARLIVTALIAKIHTVEWTPAILATKAIDVALSANWRGPPANDWFTKLGVWLIDAHSATGIPQTKPDHHGAPFSLTEDFATVYRLHPLLPDDYTFYDYRDGARLGPACGFLDIQGADTDRKIRALGLHNSLYSFGIAHPGAITLHNYPRSLQKFERNGEIIDLSVVDIVRTRRRGVPRYNAFRAGLHKPPVRRWEDMCADAETVRIMRELYRNNIDAVDTMIGLFAETCPPGFGFSDTAFRIFILMASRRIQSDRFLTVDFRPEIYSPFGMDWIAQNGMTSVILRHCPELAGSIPRDASAFAPWRVVTG